MPLGPSWVMVIPACSAAVAVRAMVASMSASTSTTAMSGSGSAPCNRDSAISSFTSDPRRIDSACSLPANRRTATGSSAASTAASASRPIALTGVLSSCETLATKSRRAASSRCAADSSCPETKIRPPSIARTTACTAGAFGSASSEVISGAGRNSTSTGSSDTCTRPAAATIRGSTMPERIMPSSPALGLASSGRPVRSITR